MELSDLERGTLHELDDERTLIRYPCDSIALFRTPDDKSGGVKIEALDAKTGKLRFTRRVSREILSAPVVRDGRVFCTMTDGSVMALDFKGKVLWHRSLQALSAPWTRNHTPPSPSSRE